MLKKLFYVSMVFFGILSLNSEFAKAETTESNNAEVTEGNKVEVKYYNEDDELFKEEIVETDPATQIQSRATKDFGNTVFSNYVYINSGKVFKDPHFVDFELTNRPKKMAVKAYTSGDTYKGKVTFEGAGLSGWQSADLDWLKRGTSYKIALVNEGSGEVRIRGGYIKYN